MEVFSRITALLDENGFEYKVIEHEPTHTCEDSVRILGEEMHAGAKALAVEGHKTKGHYLIVLPADLKIDGNKIKEVIGERVSFAEDPKTVTGCVPGSVPPLGSVLGLQTYVDKQLGDNEWISFNAGRLTHTVKMKYMDYLKVENPVVADLTK